MPLIDRQAVLKNIEKIRQSVQMMDDTHRASIIMNGMYLCEKAVRNQPSAQPTEASCWGCNCPKMERLKEQKTFSEMVHLHDAETQWIPCSERLPKQGQEVICQCRANIIKVLKLDADGDWCQDAYHCYMGGFVIAWMPLPEPYKEGDNERA